MGNLVAAYEASAEVNKFSSRFDDYIRSGRKKGILTNQEIQGMNLFDMHCGSCHTSTRTVAGVLPLFTDYGFDNVGVPATTEHPVLGTPPVDLGLGGFLAVSGNPNWTGYARGAEGKFKTPTVRNVAKGELLPDGRLNRRYMHNGVMTSLEEVVHFYNTRTVNGAGWSKNPGPGQDPRSPRTLNFKVWPKPELQRTFNGEIGNMGLTVNEELAIVAFMKTLSDR